MLCRGVLLRVHGDIGALVRESAIRSLHRLTSLVATSSARAADTLDKDLCKEIFSKIAKQAVEDDINKDSSQVKVIKTSYAKIVKRPAPNNNIREFKGNIGEGKELKSCWTCNERGHLSYECSKKPRKEDHVRKNCTNFTCQRCELQAEDCYTNLERRFQKYSNPEHGRLRKTGFTNSNQKNNTWRRTGNYGVARIDTDSEDYRRGVERGRQMMEHIYFFPVTLHKMKQQIIGSARRI